MRLSQMQLKAHDKQIQPSCTSLMFAKEGQWKGIDTGAEEAGGISSPSFLIKHGQQQQQQQCWGDATGADATRRGLQTDQVVWVHVAVHAYIGAPRGQVAHHPAGPRPEVLEGVLCIDATLNGVTLQGFIRGQLSVLGGVPWQGHCIEHFVPGTMYFECTTACGLQHNVQG